MAEALLARRLAALGSAVAVRSGGMLGDGEPPRPEAISVMAGYGLDIGAHRSRRVTAEDLEAADLTLAMARENLRHAVVTAPAVWPRAFTLRELVRRGGVVGPRAAGERGPARCGCQPDGAAPRSRRRRTPASIRGRAGR